MIDLDELERLARAAIEKEPQEPDDTAFPGCSTSWTKTARDFIASANPATVLGLIAALRAARAEGQAEGARRAAAVVEAVRRSTSAIGRGVCDDILDLLSGRPESNPSCETCVDFQCCGVDPRPCHQPREVTS